MSNPTNGDKMNNVKMNNMLQMLANNPSNKHPNAATNSPFLPPSNSGQNINLSPWISRTREQLIKTEQRDISTRIELWTKIVNDSAKLMFQKLNFTNSQCTLKDLPVFTLKDLSPAQYLSYVMDWNPLDVTRLTKIESCDDCLQHGRDWLNIRRGPKYALTLFPDLIRFAAKHSSNLGRFLYGNNTRHREMYCRALIYQCIYRLFDARIPLITDNKSQYLLCLDSIKINPNQSQQNTIAQVIAGYAEDPQFYAKCNSHELKAKFFGNKSKKQLNELQKALDGNRRTKVSHNNLRESKSPSAPPLPPPPSTNSVNSKDNDDAQSAASSVFSASSTNSKNHNEDASMASHQLSRMPSLQKAPNETNTQNQHNNNKRASSSSPRSSTANSSLNVNKNDGQAQGCKTEKNDTLLPSSTDNDNTDRTRNIVTNPLNDNNQNQHNNRSHLHQNINTRMNVTQIQTNPANINSINSNMSNGQRNSNVFISSSSANPAQQHMNNINHNNSQINQLLQSMSSNQLNVGNNNNNSGGNKHSNGNKNHQNKHIMITQMMNNNNNISANQVNQMPIVTFTNQQHKMILHLLNQLISTYNRQQMNIVYLNNRVQQLECALAKQTAKVEAIELKANNNSLGNNRAKKHKHSHHRHHHSNTTNIPNNATNGPPNNRNIPNGAVAPSPTNSVNANNPQYQYKQPKFQGNRAPKNANNMNVMAQNANSKNNNNGSNNNSATPSSSINMQNVDAISANKILRAHGIELQQLLNLVQHIPQNQMRNGMNAMNPQRTTNNNPNKPNNNSQNNNNNIIVNGNPNINQIQMRIPISANSSSNNANANNNNVAPPNSTAFNKNNNNTFSMNKSNKNNAMNTNAAAAGNGNNNWQGILNILSSLSNGQNGQQNANNNVNINNMVVRNRGNVSGNNMNMNPNTAQNQMNAINTMNAIPTLGKNGNNMNRHNAQNMNMNRNALNPPPANVAALMVPNVASLPKLNAPNPNSNMNINNMAANMNSNNKIKENKIKIKKQQMKPQPPILGAPQSQSSRKRNNRDPSNVNMTNAPNQPPAKKRKMDNNNNNMNALSNMNMNNMNNMSNMNPNNNNNNNNNQNNINLGNIMNNSMMIQMLLAQLGNENGSQSQNQ